jgi:hypothetical protein
MTSKQIKDFIENELQSTPRHNLSALAKAITKSSKQFNQNEFDMMYLLLQNSPIDSFTHSYGFHTAYGRELINTMQDYYYEFNQ